MSEEKNRRQALADQTRAAQAKELLANPLYLEAITVMRAAMYAEFEDTKLIDEDQRHELWQRMQLMKQFQNRFESIVKAGKRATKTIELIDTKPNDLK